MRGECFYVQESLTANHFVLVMLSLMFLVTLHLNLIYGDGELFASPSSVCEEIIYNEREMKSVMLAYFKYVT